VRVERAVAACLGGASATEGHTAQFECTWPITVDHATQAIRRVPGFAACEKAAAAKAKK
jgi:hypothetical protein